ncbi:MAG: hypothetical protein BroJett024_35070 [Alphaproteobacteria bacterium]|nr:MAG: hypothetical protein BroJett024_35070 [Alphaproteobacteria bacterium]
MIDEQTILAAERLRDDLADFKTEIGRRHRPASRQVTSQSLRRDAARLSERWLVELAPLSPVVAALGDSTVADLNVHFQRILTFAEHATVRSRYDAELRGILNNYSVRVILPLKTSRGQIVAAEQPRKKSAVPHSVFIGQSFVAADSAVNQCVYDVLKGIGLNVVTGEKPRADRISDKVKDLIEQQSIFVGIFTRRDKIARKSEWTTSTWVIDEKAYALGLQKPLILLKEQGVNNIGGIQGDYEYFEFSRERLELLAIKLIKLFDVQTTGLVK